MRNKVYFIFLSFAVIFCLPAVAKQGGKHVGEKKMIEADIEFFNSSGKTVTDATGTYYHYYGRVFHESKVYPSEYWGEFPLYFVGRTAGIKVTVTNRGPRKRSKIRVKTEAYILKTDGSSGITLTTPRTIDVEVAKGETKTIDASFAINNQPGLESGLDRFIVKVLHYSEGGGPGNSEPALIMQKEGVFCPPK